MDTAYEPMSEFVPGPGCGYLGIGHDWEDFDTWLMLYRKDDILVASELGVDREKFHGHYETRRYDFKGRIDHAKKAISIVPEWGTPERIPYVAALLKARWPGYSVWRFGSFGHPIKEG